MTRWGPVDLSVFLPLSHVSTLRVLDLSANGLTGTLPAEWANLTSLARLYLYDNKISGAVKNRAQCLPCLALSSNAHSAGELPPEWSALTSLVYISLEKNELSGPLPAAFSRWSMLLEFIVPKNRLSGKCGGWTSLPLCVCVRVCACVVNSMRGYVLWSRGARGGC
jgi:hypothetical protein